MYMKYFIYIILLIMILLFSIVSLKTAKEGFNTYDNCVSQGYPLDWCLRSPIDVYDSESLCSCPAGQKIYKRYGRCLCQTYMSHTETA